SSNGFGKRLAARGDPSEWSGGGVDAPDMERGALTPRGRWELKTGRKKFTAQSLLASPRSPSAGHQARLATSQAQSPPPKWGLHARGRAARMDMGMAGSLEAEAAAGPAAEGESDPALLPRGPRAFYEARSYESQWLLTRMIAFGVVANDCYQKLLDYLEASAYPIPAPVRAYKLDFRWAAAYQNIRFLVLVCAIQIEQEGGPEVLKLVALPRPSAGEGEIVVRNRFSGVNFIDTYFREGVYKAPLPHQLGAEGAGEVVEVGAGVDGFAVGDAVVYLGTQNTYAQYAVASAAKAFKIDPATIPLDIAAAALVQGLTAHTLVTRSYEVKSGDWVLVQAGAGGTGRLIIQMAKAFGANVITTVSNKEKAEVASKAGADHVILYTEESVPESVKKIVPEGVHVVYDGVGKATFDGSMQSLRRLGTMVSFGNASGTVPPVRLLDLSPKNLTILRPQLYGYIVTDEERQRHMGALVELLSQKKLDIHVFKTYDLADVAQAHIDLQGRKTMGKLLIKID
ncbi:hypothetical protein LPJ56_001015, partial [Coemansia sp. RSA 2599]